MAVMVPVVFFITGFTKGDWLDALMFALSVAVGLTPEMLPMVVTSNLAKGAVLMAREKVIVKKLSAIQDFGAMDVLCTDKTGTLTEDRIVLMKYTDVYINESLKALRYAYLNSYFETGLKNVMDTAILDSNYLPDKESLGKDWQAVDELPFDFERRRMSVILKQGDKRMLICKGAVEEMLSCTVKVDTPNGEVDATPEMKQLVIENLQRLYKDGLRVLAVGHKYFAPGHDDVYTSEEENELVLDGFMSFLDPPKESAKEAIEELKNNGIRIMVLTGDNDIIAQKVCSEVGLIDKHAVLGSELENLSDAEAINLIEQHQIFAKLAPMQKGRIVRLLREKGHTVGFMGDGINDAVSLREADIGISVDTAVDIAKESADIILLQKSLLVLNKGVLEGRKMFANTMKYIKITASSNFGNVFSLLGASLLFPFLPMLPLQILILNLIYDISQVAIPWDNVDPEYLKKPRKWVASDIKRFMLIVGPTSSIFDYVTFGVLFFIFGASTLAEQSFFQTGWFLESLFTQTMVVQVLRTEKIPFIQSRSSHQLFLSAIALLTLGVIIPYTGIGHNIGFHPIPLTYYYWLVAILVTYCVLAQFVKKWYIKKYNSWI
jgi:Mg2+-importing ATPase